MQYTLDDGTKYKRRATWFDKYTVDSTHGGEDSARLFASDYNDVLTATPTETRWQQAYRQQTGKAKYEHILKNFRTVMPRGWDPNGYSPGTDHDKAHLWMNPGDIYEELGPGEAQIHDDPETYRVWVKGFDEVIHEGTLPGAVGGSVLLRAQSSGVISDAELAALGYAQSQNDSDEEDDDREATALVLASDDRWSDNTGGII